MSSPKGTALASGAVGVALALAAVTGCSASATDRPVEPHDPGLWSAGTAVHVHRPSTTARSSTRGSAVTASAVGGSARSRMGLAEPRRVALGAAAVVCNFDWRQKLADRVAALRGYVTASYARSLQPSAGDVANWRRTEQDRESGVCSHATVSLVSGAPNSGSVCFERVAMWQQIRLANTPVSGQRFAMLYRLERQRDGRWLVAGEGDGG
jgi:hypothetical protein